MAHIVELSGEANPLTRENLLSALSLAASSTQQKVHTGTQQLQNWETQEMYYSFVQDIYLDFSVPIEVRYLAVIQLKNGIDKYWRKHATNAIKKEQKDIIKTRAIQAGVVEPAALLALHNALMIAKIIRHEFPHDWPDAVPSLIASLRSSTQPGSSQLQLPRTLLIVLHIVKDLSTARLQRTKANLQSVTPELFSLLASIYVDKVGHWESLLAQGGADEASSLETMEQSLMSLKVIRRLIIAGYEHPSRNSEAQQFWVLAQAHLNKFLSFLNFGVGTLPKTSKLIEKHLLQLFKLHVDMATTHAASFALLPDSVPLVKLYWTLIVRLGETYDKLSDESESDGKSFIEKAGLKALILIRACAKMAFNPAQTFKYQSPRDKAEKTESIDLIKTQLFTNEFVVSVMELLVTHFFRFRKRDFQEWEKDPEEWEKREEESSAAWEFSIRSCSEKLFLDLVIHFKELLISRLLNVFYSFATPENSDVLLKDSLYAAIGLAAASLEQHLDFNTFLESTLVREVQIQSQGYNVLRRRIAILLGEWVPVKPGELNKDAVFQIFQHLLNKQDPLNDLVVRITAGRQLRNVLDPFEFSPSSFMPYAPVALQQLMTLVQEVQLSDTKMGLLETIRVSVVKLEDHIGPFSDQIISLLPPLWENAGEEHLMKQAILTLLSALIHSLKQESVRYHSLILPLIRGSVEPGSESLIYLLDEALELWSAILTQTPSPARPDLLSLIPALFPIFEAATDSVPQALQIAESYIILAPQEVLGDHIRLHMLVSLETLLKSTTRQRLGIVPRLVELLIRGVDLIDPGSEYSYTVISRSLVDSSFLTSILDGLYSAHEVSQTTGPRRKPTPIYGVVETDYFSVLARLALASPKVFVASIVSASPPVPPGATQPQHLLTWLLSEWFLHYDNIGSATQKKLHALGLTQLLSLNGPNSRPPDPILNHLQSYLTTWTDILTELAEGTIDNADPYDPRNGDYLIYWNAADSGDDAHPHGKFDELEAPEITRRRHWDASDVVHRINLRDFVKQHLRSLVVGCGGEQKFQDEWLLNVDREVVVAFVALGLFGA